MDVELIATACSLRVIATKLTVSHPVVISGVGRSSQCELEAMCLCI